MKHKRTEEEIREYNKRIEEIFRKHNLIPKKVDVEKNNDFIVIFPGNKKTCPKTGCTSCALAHNSTDQFPPNRKLSRALQQYF